LVIKPLAGVVSLAFNKRFEIEKRRRTMDTRLRNSIGMGTAFGIIVGAVIGEVTGNVGLWIAGGMIFGAVVGAAIGSVLASQAAKDNGDSRPG
jgi:uncharacterized membrane protein